MSSLRWEPWYRWHREVAEQIGWRPLHGCTNAKEIQERDVLLAAFESPDFVPMKARQLAALLLTKPRLLASLAHRASQRNQRIGHRPLIAHSEWR